MTVGESTASPAMAARERGWYPPAPSFLRFLRDELTGLSPARRSRMLRMTALVVVVTIVSMALRVPDVALSAYMIFFVSKADVVTTVRTALGGIVGATLAIALTFVFYLTTLSEPALRLPAMACIIFAGMYVVRSSPAGPLGMLIAVVTGYALTFPDRGASPEVLTRALLWVWVVVSYPVALLAIADAVAGQRPAEVFNQGVAARLEAAGEYLRSGAGVDAPARMRVEGLERAGTGDISPYVKDRSPSVAAARARIVRQLDLLFLLLRELPADAKGAPEVQGALARAGDVCLWLRRAVLGEDGATPHRTDLVEPGVGDSASPATLAVVLPLLGCVEDLAAPVLAARQPSARSVRGEAREERGSPAETASSSKRTESVRFALKVTLAAMTGYIIYSSLAWPGIHTAMLTCIVVAQDSVGATIHKLTLRITGALVGAALGIGAIVFVLPQLETVGGLAVLVAAVTLLAAWIATGSQAISYAGFQVAFTFYLTVLQGFSRTSKMVVGRDRVIGILLGNLLMTVVFTHLWPVRIVSSIRQALSRATEALAATLRSGSEQAGGSKLREAEAAFHASLRAAIQTAPMRYMELGEDGGTSLIYTIEKLFVRIHAIAHQPMDVQALPPAVHTALSAMGESVARWLSELARVIAGSGPVPVFQPAVSAAAELEQLLGAAPGADDAMAPVRLRLAWYRLLDREIQRFPAHRLAPLGKDN
jgi:multidrug resistance protein MdtO